MIGKIAFCRNCGKPIEKFIFRNDRGYINRQREFCSRACWQNLNYPRSILATPEIISKQEKKKRDAIRKKQSLFRLKFIKEYNVKNCQNCKKKEQRLELHHWKYNETPTYVDFKREMSLGNLVILCKKCHVFFSSNVKVAKNSLFLE